MTQNHPLEVLEVSSRVAKRAQYEAFSFSLVDGAVQVRNESHADPAAHEYLVRVESGVPVRCTCPADDRFDGACKHRVAVAIRRPIVDAAMRASARQAGAVPDGRVGPGGERDGE